MNSESAVKTLLIQVTQMLDQDASLMDVYKELEPIILDLFQAERMSIFQRRRQHQDLVARFKTGKETVEIKVPISPLSIAGYVALSQRPMIVADPYNGELLKSIHPRLRFNQKFDKDNNFRTRNILCVPIMNADVLMGVIQIINKKGAGDHEDFTQRDLELAHELTQIIGNKFRYELGGTNGPFDYLVHTGKLNAKALEEITESGADLRTTIQRLISEQRISEPLIGAALSIHYQVPFVGFLPDKYHPYQSESRLNESYLKRNYVAVIADAHDRPIVLMSEPNNAGLLMEIESALGIDKYEIAVGAALTHFAIPRWWQWRCTG